MIQRCTNPNSTNYIYYGGRGIKVTEEWLTFEEFYKWSMSNGYSKELSIDRINVNGNYELSNCRWATREVQDNNRSDSVKVMIRGETLTLTQVAKKYGFKIACIQHRYNVGDRGEKLITPLKRGIKRDGTRQHKPELKLTKKEVSEIKWISLNTNISQKVIGERYGIIQAMVSRIKLGKSHPTIESVKPDWWCEFD
ncbi:hypothetical protein [Lysinibacillus sp. NPDC086135]|uniref:hypothetical protein n=1 Tax=Lysinibacillus sp. NPDC086135 TaxID=3364130 RepID=UPI0037F39152